MAVARVPAGCHLAGTEGSSIVRSVQRVTPGWRRENPGARKIASPVVSHQWARAGKARSPGWLNLACTTDPRLLRGQHATWQRPRTMFASLLEAGACIEGHDLALIGKEQIEHGRRQAQKA